MPKPLYVIGEPSRLPAELRPAEIVSSVDAFTEAGARAPGLLIVERAACAGADVVGLAERLYDADPAWMVATLDAGGSVRSLSVGLPHTAKEVAGFLDGAGPPGTLLELRSVLVEIARVRHDLNNPLTSALAEIQLLLLDAPEGEMRESVDIVQEQLRRLRDLIAATRHLRMPKE